MAHDIVHTLAVEAARATSQRADPALLPQYERWLRAFVPAALRVAEAEDAERPRLLDELLRVEPPAVQAVPPVARFGLLTVGVRFAREAVREDAVARGIDANAMANEITQFANALAAQMRAPEGAPRASSAGPRPPR